MDNKNSNGMRKVGKSIWKTLNAFLLTQELRCMLFWGLFSRCVFRNLSWPGRPPLLDKRQELLRQPVLELYHEDILPRQVWTLPRYFHLRSLYSVPLLPLEDFYRNPLGVFTLTRYFHLRSSCPFKDVNRIHITTDIRCWETLINS